MQIKKQFARQGCLVRGSDSRTQPRPWGGRAALTHPCPGDAPALGTLFQAAGWKLASVSNMHPVEWRQALLGRGRNPSRARVIPGPELRRCSQDTLPEPVLGASAVPHLPLITFLLLIRSASTPEARPDEGSSGYWVRTGTEHPEEGNETSPAAHLLLFTLHCAQVPAHPQLPPFKPSCLLPCCYQLTPGANR